MKCLTLKKQAVIALIEKKGKDRNYLENWRPISLINVDAKIASKVIATRVIKIIKLAMLKAGLLVKQLDQYYCGCYGLHKKTKHTRDIAFH